MADIVDDDNFADSVKALSDKEQSALKAGAELLQMKARELVPKDTGALAASLQVSVDGDEAAVYSDSIYAAAQHERIRQKHTNGQAKFLETALLANQSAIEQAIADALRLE